MPCERGIKYNYIVCTYTVEKRVILTRGAALIIKSARASVYTCTHNRYVFYYTACELRMEKPVRGARLKKKKEKKFHSRLLIIVCAVLSLRALGGDRKNDAAATSTTTTSIKKQLRDD